MISATTSSTSGLAAWRTVAAHFLYADLLAAAALPWSKTGFTVLLGLWLLSLIPLLPTLHVRASLRLLARPVCLLPLALFALAVAGTLWADSPWPERLRGIAASCSLIEPNLQG